MAGVAVRDPRVGHRGTTTADDEREQADRTDGWASES
jgi:hypothetical protein